jgi:eukaryotic-like serine/threonine-protein kinase
MSAGAMKRSTIGNYRLVDFLGAGGMGEVYRGMHLTTGRVAAVKILTATGRSPSMLERFRNEARIQAGLAHPGIVTLFEFFEADGLPCIAMEYVSGESLDHVVQTRGMLDATQALTWFAQVVDAVAYVHRQGIVHRDLKTNNIKIDDEGRARLLDFGIAKSGDSPKLTTDGSVVGTLHYLSPEQVRSSAASSASDIWALGVVLYEMVTGRVPFASETLTGVMVRILKGSYDPLTRDGHVVPQSIERIIARCLRLEPSQRYQSADALLADVRSQLSPSPSPGESGVSMLPRPSGEIVAMLRSRGPLIASVSLAITALGFVAWSSFACCQPAPVNPEIARQLDSIRRDSGRTAVVTPVRPTSAAPLRPVVIKVFGDSPAEVFRDGVLLGKTPLRFEARIGDWVTLVLKRPGDADRRERFRIVDGVNEYTYFMSPGSPSSAGGVATATRLPTAEASAL